MNNSRPAKNKMRNSGRQAYRNSEAATNLGMGTVTLES